MLKIEMPELNEMWSESLRAARERAVAEKRTDVLDYLQLRETNDRARAIGIQWLFDTFAQVAAEANRRGLNLNIEQSDQHQFQINAATMRGARIKVSIGVRSITVEAGFPRVPADGFIRGGGLAAARVVHFGLSKENADLILVRANNELDAPIWFTIDKNNLRQPFSTAHLKHHFQIFLQI